MQHCKNCKSPLDQDCKFCPNCGQKVTNTNKKKITKRVIATRALMIADTLFLIAVICALLWNYQHPSLQNSVPGSIYKMVITTDDDGSKQSETAYIVFHNRPTYQFADSKEQAEEFRKNASNNAAYSFVKNDIYLYTDDIKLVVVNHDRKNINAKVENIDQDNSTNENTHVNMTKIE